MEIRKICIVTVLLKQYIKTMIKIKEKIGKKKH